jgi:hypothetical protein
MFRTKPFACFLLAVLGLWTAGCSVDTDPAAIAKYRARQERDRKLRRETNNLWHEGFGFNNPNPDRFSKGLPPLNFDGKESKLPFHPSESDWGRYGSTEIGK